MLIIASVQDLGKYSTSAGTFQYAVIFDKSGGSI